MANVINVSEGTCLRPSGDKFEMLAEAMGISGFSETATLNEIIDHKLKPILARMEAMEKAMSFVPLGTFFWDGKKFHPVDAGSYDKPSGTPRTVGQRIADSHADYCARNGKDLLANAIDKAVAAERAEWGKKLAQEQQYSEVLAKAIWHRRFRCLC